MLKLVAIAGYTALIAWIALIAAEADPLGDVPDGMPPGIVTAVLVAASIAVGAFGRRWELLGVPLAVAAIGLVYAAFETRSYDLPIYVENEAWAISLVFAFAIESALIALGVAVGRRLWRA